ncbi:MAG: SDR family NAD(P)-dependent oxidoreductase, partial [Proteobacteria bacterium]|nr:SDR family NAD(P)-dependent oxidoreductase [Pseudomonadota bacterium]
MNLKNSVALITGASSGIGAAIALAFAKNGCHVVINYNKNEAGAQKTAGLCKAHGVKTLIQQADVSKDTGCKMLVDAALKEFGQLHVLINNAGTTKFCEHQKLDGLDKQD